MDLSIVVPVYNNADTLPELTRRVEAVITPLGYTFELILVDDGSRDESWATIDRLAREHRFVRGLRLSRNFGQHPAIAAGFEAAAGERIVLMDADLEDRPESLPRLLAALDDGAVDIVYTVVARDAARPPRWSSRLFHKFFSMSVRADVPPNIGTLRLFTRKVREAILAYREYNVLYGPLMFFLGFDCAFVEVERDAPPGRVSSYSFMKRLRLAQASLISYTNLPNTLFFGFGLGLFGVILLYIGWIVVDFVLSGPHAPPGVVLLALLVLSSLAINLVAFGVLGTYVYRVYQEVLQRPRYHVRAVAGAAPEAVARTSSARRAQTEDVRL